MECLREGIVHARGPCAAPMLGRAVTSDCGHLVKPTVRHRIEGRLARGTRSKTVRIFKGGLRRLLVRPPVTNGIILN